MLAAVPAPGVPHPVSAEPRAAGSLERQVIDVITRTQHVPLEEVRPDATFDELGIDSLAGATILFAIEDEFDIYIPYQPQELSGLTVRGAIELVSTALSES
jgi:acyl carrier protein